MAGTSVASNPKKWIYKEAQYAPWWAWLIIVLVSFGMPALMLLTVNDRPSGPETIWVTTLTVGGVSMLVMAFLGRMVTRVNSQEIRIDFGWLPSYRCHIALEQVEGVQAEKYSPLREFGGWGIKGSRDNRVLSQNGYFGVRLTLPENRKLMIGTQFPQELAQVIESVRPKT